MLLPLYNDFRMTEEDTPSRPELVEQLEQIKHCQERRNVDMCSACVFFDDCDKVKTYLRWVELCRTSGRSSEDGGS